MESKKYEFTGETMKFYTYTLRRIRALVDIKSVVKKGELGRSRSVCRLWLRQQ